jgi:hypothetical protein
MNRDLFGKVVYAALGIVIATAVLWLLRQGL